MSNIFDSLKNIFSSEFLKDAQNILKTSNNKYIGMLYQIIKNIILKKFSILDQEEEFYYIL